MKTPKSGSFEELFAKLDQAKEEAASTTSPPKIDTDIKTKVMDTEKIKIQINKAFKDKQPLEDITDLLLQCVALATGDTTIYAQNYEYITSPDVLKSQVQKYFAPYIELVSGMMNKAEPTDEEKRRLDRYKSVFASYIKKLNDRGIDGAKFINESLEKLERNDNV